MEEPRIQYPRLIPGYPRASPKLQLTCVYVGVCAHDTVQQKLARYLGVILPPLAKDPTGTNMRNVGILSLIFKINIQFIYFKAQIFPHVRVHVVSKHVY